jgi:chemotaxis protein methyltransferase CheR
MNLTPFKELIKQRCGLIFEGVGEKPLVDGLRKRITASSTENASAYYAKLYGDDHEFHELVCLLTINETYFYREPEQLQLLVDCLIPRILSRKQDASPVRILSAGCSSGEEPYSIAMALREKYGESAARLFHLAGGDIDKGVLDKARTARYTEFSFRSLAPELRERYFERHAKWTWNVKADLRRQVDFHYLNLLDENYHHALQDYDIIFFRNVSIYFDTPTRRLIQQHLAALLKNEGCLIIGTAETLANDLGVLNLVEENGMFYFSKQSVAPVRPHFEAPHSPVRHNAVTDWISAPPVTSSPFSVSTVAPQLLAPQPLANIDEALRLTREKRYDDAMDVLTHLPEWQTGATDALLLKAYILLHRKEYAAAEETAQRVLKFEAWSIDAFVVLALAAKWRNQAADAVKWFKQAVYACNECWPAHYYLAELYRAGNEMEKARRSYRVTLQLLSGQQAPSDGLAIIPLGLPPAEVRFLCEHQVAKLDGVRAVTAR